MTILHLLCDIRALEKRLSPIDSTNEYIQFANHVQADIAIDVQAIKERTEQLMKNPLEHVIGVEEAAALWNLSPGTIKNYCAEGKIIAKKIGKTWIIDKNQDNPGSKNAPTIK